MVLQAVFYAATATAAATYAFVDPEWAIPANTIAMVLLAIINRRAHAEAKAAARNAAAIRTDLENGTEK